MTLADLIASYRTDADDHANPPMTADEDVARFFAEAEEEAAIRKRLLFDDYTPEIVEIDVSEGVSRYKRDARLFEVTAVWLERPDGYRRERLVITDRDEMDRNCPGWRYDRRRPERFIVDDTSITLPCQVNADYTLRLEGYRTPLQPLSMERGDQAKPEIGPIHHRFLVHWVLHRAYSKPDTEIFNPNKAAIALAAFEQYFGLRPDADLNKLNQANRPHHNKAWW